MRELNRSKTESLTFAGEEAYPALAQPAVSTALL